MKRLFSVPAVSIIFSGLTVFAFLAGELIGMKSGYANTQKTIAPMDAAYIVRVIQMIENNQIDEAKQMLETKLDIYIINHWVAERCELVRLNYFIEEQPQEELFHAVIAHRKSHPSEDTLVQEHLKALEQRLQLQTNDYPTKTNSQ